MPTPVNWSVAAVALGPGQLWTKLSVPGAGGKLTVDSDGTPDETENPEALHVGMTDAGSQFIVKPTFTDFFADEFQDPIIKRLTAMEMSITGNWLQVMDMDIAETMTPGAVRADGPGYERLTFGGQVAFNYYSTALIFPLEDDPTKFGVFHLYKAINDPGLAVDVGAKKLGKPPFAFKGVSITSRAVGDTTGAFWKQLSVGS